MKVALALISTILLSGTSICLAASSDAREVARINNCPPKKIEVFQQTLGMEGKTVYRVECNMPKVKDDKAAPTANALLVQCVGSLCAPVRMVGNESK